MCITEKTVWSCCSGREGGGLAHLRGSSGLFFGLNIVSVLCEIAFSGNNVMPELSYGTHFFQDMVESGIFTPRCSPISGCYLNANLHFSGPSLDEFAPDYRKYDA
jgi:hypothetical protein